MMESINIVTYGICVCVCGIECAGREVWTGKEKAKPRRTAVEEHEPGKTLDGGRSTKSPRAGIIFRRVPMFGQPNVWLALSVNMG